VITPGPVKKNADAILMKICRVIYKVLRVPNKNYHFQIPKFEAVVGFTQMLNGRQGI
jgi:hypothetical protein